MDDRELEVELGMTSRQARFKRDTINIHIKLYDENKEPDQIMGTYFGMMDQLSYMIRKELGLTRKEIEDESESVVKNESIHSKAERVFIKDD